MRPDRQSDQVLMEHMLECIERINDYTGRSKTRFFDSTLLQDAVLRNLQTLAESGQRLSAECKQTMPEIPWKQMAGMRNILVHDYLGDLDMETVWRVCDRDLPTLEAALRRTLASWEEGDA